jgi:hypothetical protein
MTLPGAEDDVDVHDVIVVSVRAHQPDATGDAERHDRDVDIGRSEQRARRAWREPRHACATTSAGMQMVPPRRLQPCLHGDGFGGVAKRPGSLARQLVAEVSAQS